MARIKTTALELKDSSPVLISVGQFAHQVLKKQYQRIVKHESAVLADTDPENLHQMRVGTRRLRTALHVFDFAIALPKAASAKRVGQVGKTLGKLRDLDVQMAELREVYRPQLKAKERSHVDTVLAALQEQRQDGYAEAKQVLTRSRYTNLKAAYEDWLEQPQYTPMADLSVYAVLPDLLSSLLSTLLLHPGWLVPSSDRSEAANETLHDLRKACKHVRYQAEFFVEFYGDAVHKWIQSVKQLQDQLGKLHDIQVLTELLTDHLPKRAKLKTLHQKVEATRMEVMAHWDTSRHQYLDPGFRYSLHRLLLSPQISEPEPETNGKEAKPKSDPAHLVLQS